MHMSLTKPRRPRHTVEELTALLDADHPDLDYEIDGQWVWVLGNFKGDAHADTRKALKALGFRFKKGGVHELPSGETSRWGNSCTRPTPPKNRGRERSLSLINPQPETITEEVADLLASW